MLLWLWTLLGCEPPPLSNLESGEPRISFIFPDSSDVVVCPNFMVAVSIDSFTVDPDNVGSDNNQDGVGHWHLRDANGDYIVATASLWVEVSMGPEEDFLTPTFTGLSAHLAENNHNELNTALYPDSFATAEFTVGATEDCVGGGSGGSTDTGY